MQTHFENVRFNHLLLDELNVAYQEIYGTTDVKLAQGEYVEMQFDVVADTAIGFNTAFIYNPLLFATNGNTVPLNTGRLGGWLVKVDSVGAVTCNALSATGVSDRNMVVLAELTASDKLTIKHRFYVTASSNDFIGESWFDNSRRFLHYTKTSARELDLSVPSPYSQLWSAIDICFYQVNTADYTDVLGYTIDQSTPNNNVMTLDVILRGYDSPVNGDASFITSFVVNDQFGTERFRATALSNRNQSHDANYTQTGSPSLTYNGRNQLIFEIQTPQHAPNQPTHYIVRLLDCTKTNFVNQNLFLKEWHVDSVVLDSATAYDTTPYPNPLTNQDGQPSVFSTPWSAPDPNNLAIELDGTRLIYGHEYRVMIVAYSQTNPSVTTHLTPFVLVADAWLPNGLPEMSGGTAVYDKLDGGQKHVHLSPAERFSSFISFDVWQDPALENDLARVTCNIESFNSTGRRLQSETLSWDAVNGSSTLSYMNSSPVLLFEFLQPRRAYYDVLTSAQPVEMFLRWQVVCVHTNPDGSTCELVFNYLQRITVKPIDAARISNIAYCNHADFMAGTITYLNSICTNDRFIVVELTKSGAPDASVIPLFTTLTPSIGTRVFEAESWAGLLPQLNEAPLIATDATFGDNKAYYILDTTLLNRNVLLFGAGALIYNN